jgi:hypothetical protein
MVKESVKVPYNMCKYAELKSKIVLCNKLGLLKTKIVLSSTFIYQNDDNLANKFHLTIKLTETKR